MYFVYILYSEAFDKFYIGQTNNISIRLERHNAKKEKYTAPYVPWVIRCVIEKQTRSEAMILEKKLKNLKKERIRLFIKKYAAGGADEA